MLLFGVCFILYFAKFSAGNYCGKGFRQRSGVKAMDEMANIQKLARQALKTFRTTNGAPSKQNLDVLKSMMGAITPDDLNLTSPAKDRRRSFPGAAPVTHINIIDCPYFSMAVFIVSNGRKLPLHDHPGMHGFCKVLYGCIQVDMYGRINSCGQHETANGTLSNSNESTLQKFIYQGKHKFDSENGVCMVTPVGGNLHTIRAVNGPAAFLDILGPPYSSEEGRDCLYYKECHTDSEQKSEKSDVRYLQEIPCPHEFFCDSQPYRGPVVKLEDLTVASDE